MVGPSGSGKTTLLEGLIRELAGQGRRVAAVKHTHHRLADRPGSDTGRQRAAGAALCMLAGPEGLGLWGWEPTLEQLLALAREAGSEVVLVEGYKSSSLPKLEVARGREPSLALADLWGLATDRPRNGVRCFSLGDAAGLAAALLADPQLARP